MAAVFMALGAFALYIVAYYTYGRWLARRIFQIDPEGVTPAVELEDGVDYVPSRKEVVFGHHFTSIAGTGPIVGPAIGIIWGWVPALVWVFVGSIVMGAVHDLGSLVVSLRHQGRSISEIAARYISPRMRTICFLVVFLELWVVIAIFGLVIAILFGEYPQSVFPIWMEIPIAIGLGLVIYRLKGNVIIATAAAVFVMYATVVLGHYLPLHKESIEAFFGMPATGVWTIVLLIYAYVASTLPVTTLLQPRDYINAWQLFIMMALLILGVVGSAFIGKLHIVAPAVNPGHTGAPPMWPFLFVTIACGAISGFHSLVGSGTTPKQISNERDSLFVGYGSMLMEAVLATLVIVAVAAGIGMAYKTDSGILTGAEAWNHHYTSWSGAKGLVPKVRAVVEGSANMMGTIGIPRAFGLIIMGVFIASFAGTTLDTATRIQRYVISEMGTGLRLKPISNRWIATAIAVVTGGILAFSAGASGAGAMTLWPLFGALNQLLAALALLLVTLYLRTKGGLKFLVTAIPCMFMLAMTISAVCLNEIDFWQQSAWLLVFVNGAALLLSLWMVAEGFVALFKDEGRGEATAQKTA